MSIHLHTYKETCDDGGLFIGTSRIYLMYLIFHIDDLRILLLLSLETICSSGNMADVCVLLSRVHASLKFWEDTSTCFP